MVKRRLGDLLREEIQKPLNQDEKTATGPRTESLGAIPAKPQGEQVTLDVVASTLSPSEVPSSASPEEAATLQAVDKPHARRSHLTKADLEAKVADLQAELTTAHHREQTWQQKVDALQAETDRQQAQIAHLQAELHQTEAIAAELAQARVDLGQFEQIQAELFQAKADLQKAERLSAELEQAKTELQKIEQLNLELEQVKLDLEKAAPLPAEIEQLKGAIRNLSQENNELTNLVKQLKMGHRAEADRQSVHPLYPAVPTRPQVAPARQSGRLSNSDIGWVD